MIEESKRGSSRPARADMEDEATARAIRESKLEEQSRKRHNSKAEDMAMDLAIEQSRLTELYRVGKLGGKRLQGSVGGTQSTQPPRKDNDRQIRNAIQESKLAEERRCRKEELRHAMDLSKAINESARSSPRKISRFRSCSKEEMEIAVNKSKRESHSQASKDARMWLNQSSGK